MARKDLPEIYYLFKKNVFFNERKKGMLKNVSGNSCMVKKKNGTVITLNLLKPLRESLCNSRSLNMKKKSFFFRQFTITKRLFPFYIVSGENLKTFSMKVEEQKKIV